MDAAEIQKAYEELGYDQGWAFAMTPLAWLPTAQTVMIGLNPGGSGNHEDVCWENLDGNAYFTGRWQKNNGAEPTPLQAEVRCLHAFLEIGPDEVFAGQFIPFRSPSIAKLTDQTKAIAFAKRLWSWALPQSHANRFICMGARTWWFISELLQARREPSIPSGWGNISISRSVTVDGRIIVGLPHPSRYLLLASNDPIAKAKREAALRQAFRPADA